MTIELATRHELNGILGTLVPPAVLFAVYLLLRSHIGLKNAAFWMLAGTYLLGPLFMMVGWTALGGDSLRGSVDKMTPPTWYSRAFSHHLRWFWPVTTERFLASSSRRF
jgi:hypothetical protein